MRELQEYFVSLPCVFLPEQFYFSVAVLVLIDLKLAPIFYC